MPGSLEGHQGKRPLRRPQKLAVGLIILGVALLALWALWVSRYRDRGPVPAGPFFGNGLVPSAHGRFGEKNIEVLDDPRFGRILRVRYPKGSGSPTLNREEEAPIGGAQLYLRLDEPVDRLHLRYYVRFPEEFDYVRGGKLPGLFGGTVTGGRRSPDGTNGFSTRYMWRRNGAGEVYAYLATSRAEGSSLGRGAWHFDAGDWHLVEQEVILNEPGRENGRIRVWLDQREVLDAKGLRFRTVGSLRIEGVFFSTFFGGSDRSWVTPRNTHVDFAAFDVGSQYLGPARVR